VSRRAVVTGIGAFTPVGATAGDLWESLLAARTSVEHIPSHWLDYAPLTSRLWAPLPERDYGYYSINRIDRMQHSESELLAIIAAQQALQSARVGFDLKDAKKNTWTLGGIDPTRAGVFMGTGVGGLVTLIDNEANHVLTPLKEQLREAICSDPGHTGQGSAEARKRMEALMRMPQRFSPFVVPMIMPNAPAATIGIRYSLTGPNRTSNSACAAGTVAIGHAFRSIQSGEADFALAGGVEFLNDTFGGIYRGFDVAKTLIREWDDPQTANRPFDRDRSGFLLAEGGSAMLVIEELQHALSRGAPILAEIIGYGETFDAHSVMIMDPEAVAITRMIRGVLTESGCTPRDIDYINAHATGTQVNDEVEAAVIGDIFGAGPLVNATKSMTGHAIGAAGAIEAAVTVLSIRDQVVHTCKNLDNPVADLSFAGESVRTPLRKALTQSFAFGGHNAALVLAQFEPPA
jgi:3-oxoacyl-[acyl-carrier-protein] synthase II